MKSSKGLKDSLGPGLLMAAAAIGVSHLVQSTRAGANYGFALVWAVLLANLFKYPFLEFGPRYAVATRQSLLDGYQRVGNWAMYIFIVFTLGTMFTVQAAVTIVAASLAAELTGLALTPLLWSVILLVVCIGLLISGRYSVLDGAIKSIMVVLAVSTIIALVAALFSDYTSAQIIHKSEVWTVSGVAFVIALMGWMPIPIDAAAWHSLWTLERTRQTHHSPSLRESLIDFNIGYIGAAVLALMFLCLGALIMFGAGHDFASSGGVFAQQLVSLYTQTLGTWSYPVIIICAFTTMFSTTLTVTDAYPRVVRQIIAVKTKGEDRAQNLRIYRILLVVISMVSLGVLAALGDDFTLMVDLATTLSFLTAPVLAFINFKVVTAPHVPENFRPRGWLKWLSWAGILFLSIFALIYVYWQLFI